MKKALIFLAKHKAAVILIIILAAGGSYWYVKNKDKGAIETRYVLSKASTGNIVSSVSGSGQISASNQIAVKPKVSGDALKVNIVSGQEVKTGDVLVQIDSSDAYKTVRDAKTSLDTAKLNLDKLKNNVTELDITKAENSLDQAKNNLEQLKSSQVSAYQNALDDQSTGETTLNNYYDSALSEVSDAFLDLPNVLDDLKDMFYSNTIDSSKQNIDWYANQTPFGSSESYRADFDYAYNKARDQYDDAFNSYKIGSRSSDRETIETLINETYDTSKTVADAVKSADNYLRFVYNSIVKADSNIPSVLTSDQADIQSYTNTIQSHVTSLSNSNKNIDNAKKNLDNYARTIKDLEVSQPIALAAAEQSIKEKELSLADLKDGPDVLDLRSQELSVQQKQEALNDAYEKLADYTVKAPFDGVIAKVSVEKGDSLSSASELFTLITKQQIAEISLNEVDAAKIKAGQKATLTFDAVEGLSVTGEVADIDSIGSVSQGVVTYTVKISLDTVDERIKPGMSVSASIITNFRQDVVVVSSSAIKTSGDLSYIEAPNGELSDDQLNQSSGVLLPSGVTRKTVTLGISDDTQTEILSGLNEGDVFVSRTVTSGSQTTTNSNTNRSLLQTGGGNRSAGMLMGR